MAVQDLIHHWQSRLRRRFQEPVRLPPPTGVAPPFKTVAMDRKLFAFGLDWRFYADSRDLRRSLGEAQRDGQSHYVRTSTQDMVGLGLGEGKHAKAKCHSAALHLAETVSQGGFELFVFQHGADLYSITALHDSRPVAGFDQLGPADEILSLAGQFQVQQVGQSIRQAGNAGVLDNEESLKPATVFGSPTAESLLRKLPNYRLRLLWAAGLALALGLAWFMWWWINMEDIKAAQAKRQREQDPNFIYERDIGAAMKNLGLPVQIQLQSWRAAIQDVPLAQNGWSLQKIQCVPAQCEASWAREFGNYTDFYIQALPGTVASTESQNADNPAQASIQTLLKVQAMASGRTSDRSSLPALRDSMQVLASQLQDMALLPHSKVQLKAPELYPSLPGLKTAQILKPVVRGSWSLTHELWSLADLELKGSALVGESLLIQRDEKTRDWSYTLTGNYYAKGKDF